MKVQKKPKLKKIEAHITPDGDDNITKIAKNEEISVSNMIRTSIDQIFQMYPLYNAIGSLLSHGVIQRMPSPVLLYSKTILYSFSYVRIFAGRSPGR